MEKIVNYYSKLFYYALLPREMPAAKYRNMVSAQGLGVFRMGAANSAQNNKCGSIQTQHEFPHLLYEGKCFFENAGSSLKWFSAHLRQGGSGTEPEPEPSEPFSIRSKNNT